MTKLLLHYFSLGTEKKLTSVSFRLPIKKALQSLCITIIVILSGETYGQDLDTWLTADRAVNSPPLPSPGDIHLFTPYPPISGTPVTHWYDFIDFVPQDAVPHPAPADYPLAYPIGFDYTYPNSGIYPLYLDPSGSIPGIPTLERNSMNFNPIVHFDGSGNGQALHFRADSRKEVTIFVVFRAQGAGNSAETQRLLFGGDIDQHHWSFNVDEWLTNLSLGVSDGNRFSVGRTWISDGGGYFQSGSIDLLQKPTIGMFKRETRFDFETLTTHVNGVPDILADRGHMLADNNLYFFNRLGKHFNSNDPDRNLTGDIAEILLFDGPLPPTATQIAESYLAVKYGITLSNGPGLGSEFGNENYDYLAADGSVIWQAESTYKYDIAGIGADRYRNQESPILKLRYNLHQRISKSENPEAVVTMSTNNDFSTDNLDDTRPVIDKNGLFTYLHNFLLWGSDRGSLNKVNVELPANITNRIEREWRVQVERSLSVDPIENISIRIDLSGSDILDNGDCGLKLLIDTDGDGDFTTGPITMIDVTSVDGSGNAYFDNVTFDHRDVFTVGFGDTEPPTASNPVPITVCDAPPAADPLEVTDEADNCAVDTVTHIGDVSDGLSNPETITRTYRITDTSGNFVDVQQQILVYTTPDVDDITDQVVCSSYTLPAITGSNLTADAAYFTQADGNGTEYAPGETISYADFPPGDYPITLYIYDVVGTAPDTCSDQKSFTLDISQQPNAGNDAILYICQGDTITVEDLFSALGGTPDNGGNWSPAPAGAGVYTYTVPANGNCSSSTTAQVTVIEEHIGAFVEPVYTCSDNNLLSNSILVTFIDPSVNDNLMFALDSTDPNDFRLSPDFINISPGEHSLFIMNSNGCLFEHLFTIEDIEPLELSLSSENVNEITANVTGGSGSYTYYFDNEDGSDNNTYTIDRDGTFFVRVVDGNGCEITESITLNFADIFIPDFFTPDNNDGQNDFWGPRNVEAFPNIETFIFDRYGRKIKILGQFDVWDGLYESKRLPSGDYWYIVKLNDGSGREYVGHFTLYR